LPVFDELALDSGYRIREHTSGAAPRQTL
jgi:hypothetical protein